MQDRGIVRWTALTVVLALVLSGCSGAAEDTDTASAAATGSSDPAVVSGDGPAPTGAPSQPAPAPTSGSTQPESADAEQTAGDGGGGDAAAGAPAPPEIVAAAVADLAGRLNARHGDIDVRLAEQVTWPDNSIGCPLRDRQYLDGPIEGTRVHLFANRDLFRYHAGGERSEPFLCEISLKTEIPIRRLEP